MQGSELRIPQLILGGAAVVVFVLALVLSFRHPSLSYETDVTEEDGGRVDVTCTSRAGGTYLSETDEDRRFEVTDGQDWFDRLSAEESDQAYDQRENPHRPYGVVNGDCADAQATRAKQVAWMLAAGTSLVAACAAVTALRAARRGRPSGVVPPEPMLLGARADKAGGDTGPGAGADRSSPPGDAT